MAMTDVPTQPMFSILMPVYNHIAYVREAVASVQAQTFRDWQLVICDDGSTDGSWEVVNELAATDGRITVVRQANAGAGPARNTARRSATGRWIAFLDSDDVYYPDALAAYVEHIEANPEHGFIYGYRNRLNDDGTTEELTGEFQDAPTTARELFGRMYMSTLCVTMRAELYDRVDGYDERLRSCEDYDLYLRLSPHSRFYPLGKATGLRRRHATNVSRQTGYSRMLEATVLRRYIEHFGGRELLSQEAIDRRLGKITYSAGRQYFKQRCFRQAEAALSESLEYGVAPKRRLLRLLAWLLRPFGRVEQRDLPDL
jgi:glycosyltransferase involved in cell wall biosynthesis